MVEHRSKTTGLTVSLDKADYAEVEVMALEERHVSVMGEAVQRFGLEHNSQIESPLTLVKQLEKEIIGLGCLS